MIENILFRKDSDSLKKFSYGSNKPEIVIFPNSTQEICQIMRWANREHKKIFIFGNNTQKYLGGLIEPFEIAVSISQLNNVIEYDINNLTITVEAGLKLNELQNQLRKKKQFLPMDPPGGGNSTIGGIVAANSSGPYRYQYGTYRDLILGMSYVLPDGTQAKIGGKTMKNVAGYDITKLLIGSMGTLGTIVQITLRLYPLPENCETVKIEFNDLESCTKFIYRILDSKLMFSSLDLFNYEAIHYSKKISASPNKYILLIRFEGEHKIIHYSIEKLNRLFNLQSVDIIAKDFWRNFQRLPLFSSKLKNTATIKVSLPISNLYQGGSFIEACGKKYGIPVTIISYAGNGIIYASFPTDQFNKSINLINELRSHMKNLSGHLIVEKVPLEFKKELDVWGSSGVDLVMLKRIKNQFDPYHTIAAGRFVGGI